MLRRKIVTVCLGEVECTHDEYHLDAILSDIENISAELGAQLQEAKYQAWNKMEGISLLGEPVGDEEDYRLDNARLEGYQGKQEHISGLLCSLSIGDCPNEPTIEN